MTKLEATPCPVTVQNPPFSTTGAATAWGYGRLGANYHRRAHDGVGVGGEADYTESFEYKKVLQDEFKSAAPRRRQTASRRTALWQPEVAIHEDNAHLQSAPQRVKRNEDQRSSIFSEQEGDHTRSSTILGRPAHRIPPAVQASPSKPIRRRVSALLAERELAVGESTRFTSSNRQSQIESPKMRKEPRRRTIYVPSDDTTIMTIHPGASLKPDKACLSKHRETNILPDLVSEGEDEGNSQLGRERAPRKSLAAAPKRAPLQQSSRPVQGTTFSPDIAGRGVGKENIPPGAMLNNQCCKGSKGGPNFLNDRASLPVKGLGEPKFASNGINSSTAASRARVIESKKRTNNGALEGSNRVKLHKSKCGPAGLPNNSSTKTSSVSSNTSSKLRSSLRQGSPKDQCQRNGLVKPPSKLSVPLVVQMAQQQQEQYPVLSSDTVRVELYEDNWLSHQEAAITQLVNSLFGTAEGAERGSMASSQHLGNSLLEIYHEPSMPLMYKRMQASLLYGALSIPKDLLSQAFRIKDDLGLRRKFLDLWLETYSLPLLKAAVEAVIGRRVNIATKASSDSGCGPEEHNTKTARKNVETFLEIFLIRNEDAVNVKHTLGSIGSIARGGQNTADGFGTQGWSWRRTVLRSLMLVYVLDQAKISSVVTGCLFLPSSPHKSSVSVLHALGSLVLPSIGDITRPLGHLNYLVKHVQYPLQEYTYRITNLATDLRDGVRLTRLVELLLYPPSMLAHQKEDITVTMPTGDILTTSTGHKDLWVLSHHLKFPCLGRAQKVYNTQIALSALQGVRGVGNMIDGVKAEDIVDGYREKTVGLLWGLVGKWGLETLLDWRELESEIRRLNKKGEVMIGGDEFDSEDESELEFLEGLEKYTFLLKLWAKSVAKLHGLRVANLTTSFADGRIFEKIVDEYEQYFPSIISNPTLEVEVLDCKGLEAKLKRLGCNKYFASLFGRTTHNGRVFDRDFTIAALSFLCSRLLGASKKGRAATVIQSAWRHALLRRAFHKRCVAMRLAHDCQTVVVTRDRVITAARIIQSAWRLCLSRKIGKLVDAVTGLQARSRGWLVRKELGGEVGVSLM
ncbi:MAG: hypothetical protein M1812_000080 [Candelaria pacifica]|nr:MAG: hypothetical protein M1812_000080 [Candelaria pacifica]